MSKPSPEYTRSKIFVKAKMEAPNCNPTKHYKKENIFFKIWYKLKKQFVKKTLILKCSE